MRLMEQEIDMVKELAQHSQVMPFLVEVEKELLLDTTETLIALVGLDKTLELLDSLGKAFRHHEEHANMLHNGFLGFRELMSMEAI